MKIIDENLKKYRDLPMENVKKDVQAKYRDLVNNKNASLLHEEFYEIILEILSVKNQKEKDDGGR